MEEPFKANLKKSRFEFYARVFIVSEGNVRIDHRKQSTGPLLYQVGGRQGDWIQLIHRICSFRTSTVTARTVLLQPSLPYSVLNRRLPRVLSSAGKQCTKCWTCTLLYHANSSPRGTLTRLLAQGQCEVSISLTYYWLLKWIEIIIYS